MVVDSPTSESEQANATDPPELSPLWGLTLVLGEIALRVAREEAHEATHHEASSPDTFPDLLHLHRGNDT